MSGTGFVLRHILHFILNLSSRFFSSCDEIQIHDSLTFVSNGYLGYISVSAFSSGRDGPDQEHYEQMNHNKKKRQIYPKRPNKFFLYTTVPHLLIAATISLVKLFSQFFINWGRVCCVYPESLTNDKPLTYY